MRKASIRRTIGMLVVLFACSLISGCYVSMHSNMGLYAVRGPVTTETPVREGHIRFTAHVTFTPVYFAASKSGKIAATLGDGEACKGEWKLLPTPADNPIASDWDAIYGPGFYLAQVVGARQFVQADLTGSQGTTLHFEMYWPEAVDRDQIPQGKGVATDNHGNVYKVVQ